MNPQKLDGALLSELASAGGGRFLVLVRTKPKLPPAQQERLRRYGAAAQSSVLSLELDQHQIAELSDESSVLSISLSRRLRPL